MTDNVDKVGELIGGALQRLTPQLMMLDVEIVFLLVDGAHVKMGGNTCPACMANILDNALGLLATKGVVPGDPCLRDCKAGHA